MRYKLWFFTTCIFLHSCYDIEEYQKKRDMRLLPKVVLEPEAGIKANGLDSLRIKVVFPQYPNPELTKVNFITTEGVFFDSNKAEYSTTRLFRDSTGTFFIYANLKATTSRGKHLVTIEMPEVFSKQIWVEFLPSYPNAITTNKNKFAVAKAFTDEIQLIANLSSTKGLPNKGTSVEFIVADTLSSNSSRLFRSLSKTDSNGQASVYFTPGMLGGYVGPVTYKVITLDESNKEIIAYGTFEVVEPEQ